MRFRPVGRFILTLALLLAASCAILTSPAFADEAVPVPEYGTFDELDGKQIGLITGSTYDLLIEQSLGGTYDFSYFTSTADLIVALQAGKIDAFATDEPVARLAVNQNEGLTLMPEEVTEDNYGFFFAKGSSLVGKFDEVIDALEADGTLDALEAKWTGSDESEKTLPEQDWETPNGTLTMATHGLTEPMSYYRGGAFVGYDIELALLVCKELGYGLGFTSADYSSIVAAVSTGKADFAGGAISITAERKEAVDFTRPGYFGSVCLVVRDANHQAERSGFFDGIANSFRKTFIEEDRWQLILSGLGVTILISVCAGVLGTLLGYATVLARRSGVRWIGALVDGYQAIMGGIPLVVILMVLYYVVFGSVNIAGEIVSIIAFTLSFGATSGSTMWTAVTGIDGIQEETGLALGYTREQTFNKIVFPQALQQFLPQLMGQFVGLVKETAIVGYIAVQDLTRASDLIRSRTMDAFFPLISTAIIYFLFCRVLAWALGKLAAHLDIHNRPREIEGVEQ